MRARILLLCSGAALIAAALGVQACGDTETNTPANTTDAGGDTGSPTVADTGAKKDTAPPEEDANTCDPTKNFSKDIPDAAIGDSGSTTGLCLKCGNDNCQKQIDDCNKDCPCQEVAGDALDCYLKNSNNPLICASAFQNVSPATQNIGIALLGCINNKCKKECATESFTGSDAGDAGDADAN